MTVQTTQLEYALAKRLKALRTEHDWSLDKLAELSGVSRATLSRIEKNEVSPTALILDKLCGVFDITLSRLMLMIESPATTHIKRDLQTQWEDKSLGFKRRNISPPADSFSGEMLECELSSGAIIHYDAPAKPGLEHHLFMLSGTLELSLDGVKYTLNTGDCLRYKLQGCNTFKTLNDLTVRYILVLI